jgi:hypothetical protein
VINVASNHKSRISEATPPGSRIFGQLKLEFANMRSLQREFHEVLIDPYTVSLSKHNRGLRTVFKRSGLNHRNQDHWKYLLSVVAAALYPSTSIVETRKKERKKKWSVESNRAFFLEVAQIYIETGNPIICVCAHLKGLPPEQRNSHYSAPDAETLENKFSKLWNAAKIHVRKTNEPWLGIDQGELRSLMEKIEAKRREQRSKRQKRKS